MSSQLDLLNPPRLLDDARADVAAGLTDGVDCPCCGQFAKLYRRHLNAPMAVVLIWLVRAYRADPRWYHIKEFPEVQNRKAGGDFAKLIHWGVVEQQANEDDTKRTSGMWRPTEAGTLFAQDETKTARFALIYNGELRGWSDDTTTIRRALGVHFDYAELMGVHDAA